MVVIAANNRFIVAAIIAVHNCVEEDFAQNFRRVIAEVAAISAVQAGIRAIIMSEVAVRVVVLLEDGAGELEAIAQLILARSFEDREFHRRRALIGEEER